MRNVSVLEKDKSKDRSPCLEVLARLKLNGYTCFGFVVRLLGLSRILGFGLSFGRETMMMMSLMVLMMWGLRIPRRMLHLGHHTWRSMAKRLYTLLVQLRYRFLRWL
jgi:hypothetical protein